MSSRRRALVAAAIGAGGALLNLIVIFGFSFFGSGKRPEFREARLQLTRQELADVALALEAYRKQEGRYPPSLIVLSQRLGLRRPVNIFDPSAGFLTMRPFQYKLAPDGTSYDLFSVGPDGKPGTEDDIRRP